MERTQLKPISTISMGVLLLSGIAFLPIIPILEKTIFGTRLALECALIGGVFVGIPVCWLVRKRKFYSNLFLAERAFVWMFLIIAAVTNSISIGIMINSQVGIQKEHALTAEIVAARWSPKHGDYSLIFYPEGYKMELELTKREYRQHTNDQYIHLKTRSGYFGFPFVFECTIDNTIGSRRSEPRL